MSATITLTPADGDEVLRLMRCYLSAAWTRQLLGDLVTSHTADHHPEIKPLLRLLMARLDMVTDWNAGTGLYRLQPPSSAVPPEEEKTS